MPIISDSEEVYRDAPPPYFKTLSELDDWDERPKHRHDFNHVLPYTRREDAANLEARGKLLVGCTYSI